MHCWEPTRANEPRSFHPGLRCADAPGTRHGVGPRRERLPARPHAAPPGAAPRGCGPAARAPRGSQAASIMRIMLNDGQKGRLLSIAYDFFHATLRRRTAPQWRLKALKSWGGGGWGQTLSRLAALAQNETGAVLQATYRPGVCEGLTPSKNSMMSLKG